VRWPRSTPGAQGLDAAVLQRLDTAFATGAHGNVDGWLVIRNGHVVFERTYLRDYDTPWRALKQPPGMFDYYDPEWHPFYKRSELHTLQSVSKSVTSALGTQADEYAREHLFGPIGIKEYYWKKTTTAARRRCLN
jgi:hypothetical protein